MLVLDDKWKATITARVEKQLNHLALELVARIHELADRYRQTLGDLEAEQEDLRKRVAAHMVELGYA